MKNLPVIRNTLESYLIRINELPLLSQKEEFELGVMYRKHDDINAAQKLITSNLRFVVKVAFEYKSYGFKVLDLIQEGNIGMMMASRNLTPTKGIGLSPMLSGGSGLISRILSSKTGVW